LLKGFLEQISAHGVQVVPQQIAQPEVVFGIQVLAAPEQ